MIEFPAHLSYSGLTSYVTCGQRYWIERMVGQRGGTSWALLGGSAIHDMTADWDMGKDISSENFSEYLQVQIERTRAAGVDEADISATGRVSKAYPNKRDKQWWLENGPAMFNRWVAWSGSCPWELLNLNRGEDRREAVEFEVSDYIGNDYVKAYVDRAYVLASGEPVVVDLKTGVTKPSDVLQLGVYAVLMEKTLGVRPTYGYYWMAEDGGTSVPYDLSRYTEDYLDHLFQQQVRGMEAGVFLPHVTPFCSGCGVREFCPAVGGARASELPSPAPVPRSLVQG